MLDGKIIKEVEHGTSLGYDGGCRCKDCKRSHATRLERNRKNRKYPNRNTRWPFDVSKCRMCKQPKTKENTGSDKNGRFHTYCKECDKKRGELYRYIKPVSQFKAMDKQKGLSGETDLTDEYVLDLYKGPCSYCRSSSLAMTLDRIDNNKGHTKENCIPCCRRCNFFKKDIPHAAWELLIPALKEIESKGLFGDWNPCPKNFRVHR